LRGLTLSEQALHASTANVIGWDLAVFELGRRCGGSEGSLLSDRPASSGFRSRVGVAVSHMYSVDREQSPGRSAVAQGPARLSGLLDPEVGALLTVTLALLWNRCAAYVVNLGRPQTATRGRRRLDAEHRNWR
jgi:hypothetical protein